MQIDMHASSIWFFLYDVHPETCKIHVYYLHDNNNNKKVFLTFMNISKQHFNSQTQIQNKKPKLKFYRNWRNTIYYTFIHKIYDLRRLPKLLYLFSAAVVVVVVCVCVCIYIVIVVVVQRVGLCTPMYVYS